MPQNNSMGECKACGLRESTCDEMLGGCCIDCSHPFKGQGTVKKSANLQRLEKIEEALKQLEPYHYNVDEDCWFSCPRGSDYCNDKYIDIPKEERPCQCSWKVRHPLWQEALTILQELKESVDQESRKVEEANAIWADRWEDERERISALKAQLKEAVEVIKRCMDYAQLNLSYEELAHSENIIRVAKSFLNKLEGK